MAFNRAYNELETVRGDWKKVESFAERHKGHWPKLRGLAAELASLECIGSEPVEDSDLVAPPGAVKVATHFLREHLGLTADIDMHHCVFASCQRDEKRRICDRVNYQPWTGSELSALLRLVYQVLCNLMHGEKRLMNNDEFQTNRDRELIRISSQILDHTLQLVIK
jgi:hypothetical protein